MPLYGKERWDGIYIISQIIALQVGDAILLKCSAGTISFGLCFIALWDPF